MVHDSKRLTQALIDFIMSNVSGHRTSFEVSGPKRDGTICVRFRSSPVDSSLELSFRFADVMTRATKDFVQTDDNKFRLALGQFECKSVPNHGSVEA